MNFIIFNVAESYIFIYKYGILHMSSPSTASSTQPINNNFFGLLFWIEILLTFQKIIKIKIIQFLQLYILLMSFIKINRLLVKII